MIRGKELHLRAFVQRICAIAAPAALALSLVGCGGQAGSDQAGDASTDDAAQATQALTQNVSSLMPAYSTQELVEKSTLVASGTVTGISDPMLIQPSDGTDPRYYTDAYVQVGDVLKGSSLLNDDGLLVVRFCGGAGDVIETVDDSAPSFAEGESYLLFLYRVTDGSDYNTEGNHYYAVAGSEGAWVQNDSGSFVSYEGEGYTLEAISDVVASVPAPASDADDAGIRSATGLDFATVMTDAEVQAYEQETLDLANSKDEVGFALS